MSERLIRTDKGLDIPIAGEPEQKISLGPDIKSVAILGADHVGMKPTMLVQPGDRVKLGQPVFEDKKTKGVIYTAPTAGVVRDVIRGPKRRFDALVIDVESSDGDDEVTFQKFEGQYFPNLARDQVCDNLITSGLWTALRTRPYGKTPEPGSEPHSIFVTVTDTNPLAAKPGVVLADGDLERDFLHGVQVLTALTEGKVYVCRAAGKRLPEIDAERAEVVAFDGPHPAGLVGTHIHYLAPVSGVRTVWYVGYQDVAAIGHLFLTGRLRTDRVISLAGPAVKKPRLIKTRLGASLKQLTEGELEDGKLRVISGSVLSGRTSEGELSYLGRFDSQVSVLKEGGERELLGWATPGAGKFSLSRAFSSAFTGLKDKVAMTTTANGSKRAIVPIGMYERVMPLDIIATPLLKSLMVQDTEYAQALGCLELEEEDVALCTFVCPSKNEYGPMLRKSLTTIEIEG